LAKNESIWGRLGLQKRIIAYVIVGLVIIFSAFAYLGLQAVNRSTELIFEERLKIAHVIAAAVEQSSGHLAANIEVSLAGQETGYDVQELQTGVEQVFAGMESSQATFFSMAALEVWDSRGELVAQTPQDFVSAIPTATLRSGIASAVEEPRLMHKGFSGDLHDDVSGLLIFPLSSFGQIEDNPLLGVAYMTRFLSNEHLDDLLPEELLSRDDDAATESLPVDYGIEIIDKTGNILLGGGEAIHGDSSSVHITILREFIDGEEATVSLHHQASDKAGHMIAAVPMQDDELYLILEQDQDIALSLPDQLRRDIIIFGIVGFLGALLVAWITTRHVVRPTKQLVLVATRIGEGDLESPVKIHAQDEIGKLAEVLESMRRRLQAALHDLEEAKRDLEARVQERTLRLELLMGKVITAQEEERRRLATELHDETAQALASLSLSLGEVMEGRSTEEEQAERIKDAKVLVDRLMEETRRLIYALRPSVLDDMGLVAALRWYTEEQLERHGIEVTLEEVGLPARLPEYIEVALFRIAQEAMNNVVKHAGATTVHLRIRKLQETVVLEVKDNGVGFNPETLFGTPQAHKGVGLAGMEERAVALGGKITVHSVPGKGTSVMAQIPIS
jgi:signal transduction histidine kinase